MPATSDQPCHTHFYPTYGNRLVLHALTIRIANQVGMIFKILAAAIILPVVGTTIATSLGAFSFEGLSNQAGNALVAGIPLFFHAFLFLIGCAAAIHNRKLSYNHNEDCAIEELNKSDFIGVSLLAFSASYAILATTTSLGLHDLSFGGVISNEASILVFASAAAAILGAWGVACWAQRDRTNSKSAPVLGFIAGGAVAAGVMCGLQYSDVLDLASAAMPAEAAIALISLGSAIAVSMLACAIHYNKGTKYQPIAS